MREGTWEELNYRFEILHTTHGAHVEVTRRNSRQESDLDFPVDYFLSASIIIAYHGINSCDSFVGVLYPQITVGSAKYL
jgi:hypothetical protein